MLSEADKRLRKRAHNQRIPVETLTDQEVAEMRRIEPDNGFWKMLQEDREEQKLLRESAHQYIVARRKQRTYPQHQLDEAFPYGIRVKVPSAQS